MRSSFRAAQGSGRRSRCAGQPRVATDAGRLSPHLLHRLSGVRAGLGFRLRRHRDELRSRLATVEERRLLSLPQVSVVLDLARTGYAVGDKPVIVVHQVRRGDGATFCYDIAYPGR